MKVEIEVKIQLDVPDDTDLSSLFVTLPKEQIVVHQQRFQLLEPTPIEEAVIEDYATTFVTRSEDDEIDPEYTKQVDAEYEEHEARLLEFLAYELNLPKTA